MTIPIITVHRDHRATVESVIPLEFQCPSCGHEADARVEAVGYGAARGSILFDDGRAAAEAYEGARYSAWRVAKGAMAFVPCPACSRRDAAGIAKFALVHLILGALTGLPFGGLAWLIAHEHARELVLPVGMGAVALPAAVWIAIALGRRVTTARRVFFAGPTQ